MITALFDAVSYRDLAEIRGWAEELAEDPALATSPFATAVLGIAAEAVYHRVITFGPTGSPTPGRSWRAMTPDRGKGNCPGRAEIVQLARRAIERNLTPP